ncbi:hypothetical protein Celal_3827 [Cellulophaga algicola DSM 14237]|uniref:Tetratricopeptide repeat protein n=1 Tax=Cellulophaga algicola (strain DSM 14237 / IC166 / ACAM 630) TaxID=688270 RepID=E6XBG1_CELAD|nr:DUF6340 family protein [Cellulophaga algicola]ADV51074.1 hypothetical protein Celal_3827 [Cellulophaga algicola DSM 14237]
MKNQIKLLTYLSITLLMTACGSTNKMTMGVTTPAKVYLSSDVKSIGIINRSEPSKGNKGLDKIDQILSAEGLNLDKKGAEAAISAFASELGMLKNLDEIKIIENVEEVKSGLGVLPATLSWETIEMLCDTYHVDVIFSLAFYDTNTKSSFKVTTMPLENNLGVKVNVPAQEVTLNTLVNCGWRLYDPKTKLVIDERNYTKEMLFHGQGINPIKAVEAVKQRNETVQEYSRNVGIAYAQRLVPNKIRISRDYYMSGTDNFKVAHRRALTGDWDGAAELWKKELNNSDLKIQGRANYNMAISSEIDGDLDLAISYASKAYTDYENKLALDYVNILKYRVEQNNVLDQQRSH